MKRRARVVAGALHAVSITALAAGASVLFLMSMAASLNEYGRVSLVDGYWLGPLPWTTLGVGLTLFGATSTVAALAFIAWLTPGWPIRILATAAVLSVAFWWATAPMIGMGGACCFPRPPFDPITVAYSAPTWAASLVVGPAVALAAVDWLWRPAAPIPGPAPDYRTVSGA